MLTVREVAELPGLGLSSPRARRGPTTRSAGCTSRSSPTHALARGRRAADHDGARGRRALAAPARVRAPARRTRAGGPRVRRRLRLGGAAGGARRRGRAGRLPARHGAVRGAVHRADEGGLGAARERAARAGRAGARGARAARPGRPRGARRARAPGDRRRAGRLLARTHRRGRPSRRRAPRRAARHVRGRARAVGRRRRRDWSLRAGKPRGELSEYDRLVLHHGQTALAFELSRRHAVSAAELRLAGDLLEDLEHDRLDEREIGRRIAAFGLDPRRTTPRSSRSAPARRGRGPAHGDRAGARRRGVRYLSASRRDRAAFLVATDEEDALALARELVEAAPGIRVGVGRPGREQASAAACSRRARHSTPSPDRSPPTTTSARSSCCSACRAPRSRRSSPASSDRPPPTPGSSNRWRRCSTAVAAGARRPTGSACTATRSGTGWSSCASRPAGTRTIPSSEWSSGWR